MASDTRHEPAHQAAPAPAAPKPDPAAVKEEADQRAEGSIGAQIILDFNSDGGKAARGGMGVTLEENTAARDAHYIALGLNPAAPSGPPSGDPWEPPAVQAAVKPRHVMPLGVASKNSSLAAGIQDAPTPPPTRAH